MAQVVAVEAGGAVTCGECKHIKRPEAFGFRSVCAAPVPIWVLPIPVERLKEIAPDDGMASGCECFQKLEGR